MELQLDDNQSEEDKEKERVHQRGGTEEGLYLARLQLAALRAAARVITVGSLLYLYRRVSWRNLYQIQYPTQTRVSGQVSDTDKRFRPGIRHGHGGRHVILCM